MDIKIGTASKIGAPGDRGRINGGAVEAQILAIRAPRRRAAGPPANRPEKRGASNSRDPINGRVLVLLISDANALPENLAGGSYRVFLRFARR